MIENYKGRANSGEIEKETLRMKRRVPGRNNGKQHCQQRESFVKRCWDQGEESLFGKHWEVPGCLEHKWIWKNSRKWDKVVPCIWSVSQAKILGFYPVGSKESKRFLFWYIFKSIYLFNCCFVKNKKNESQCHNFQVLCFACLLSQ